MSFLLNDTILNINADELSIPTITRRFGQVGFEYIQQLAQELFSEAPTLQQTHPERAMKLAALIRAKQPSVNAALFVAPALGCPPSQVGVKFASIDVASMANLQKAHSQGALDAVFADREVWRRLAA
jgi:hypothetical protein